MVGIKIYNFVINKFDYFSIINCLSNKPNFDITNNFSGYLLLQQVGSNFQFQIQNPFQTGKIISKIPQQSPIINSQTIIKISSKSSLNHIQNMINHFMQTLYTNIHKSLIEKTVDFIRNKTQSYGIDIKQCYHKQRLIFLISQHIAHYIDLHVQYSKEQPKQKQCNINDLLKKKNSPNSSNFTRNHSIFFAKAVYLHHYIFGSFDIFKSVKFIEQMEIQLLQQYEKEQITLEVFKDNEQIKELNNQRQFSCICRSKNDQQAMRCEKCMKMYHPQCQYQKIVCNRCFLAHFFFPIDSTFFSKFGERRSINTYFHGKLHCFNSAENKRSLIFLIKFDIDDFSELQNANQPEFIIKMMNFKDLSNESERFQKWKMLTVRTSEYSIFVNTCRFEFFLNYFQLKRKNLYFRNQNSLIFKLQNRLPMAKNNILIIKCDIDSFQDEYYQIGIFRMSKKNFLKSNQESEEQEIYKLSNQKNSQTQFSYRITQDQFQLLQKYSTNYHQHINIKKEKNIPKKQANKIKQNEEDQTPIKPKGSNLQLVRSYGCNHKQGFKLSQLKQNHLAMVEYYRYSHQNKQQKNQIQKLIQNQLFKQYRHYAHKMNVKTEQLLQFDKKNIQNILQYCIDQKLIKNIQIPQLEIFGKDLVKKEISKYLANHKIKNCLSRKKHVIKNRHEQNQKQQKKYMKFVKCPICKNYLFIFYLLPFQMKEGDQIKILDVKRQIKKKKEKQSQKQAQQSMLKVFKPASIFRTQYRGKKEEESDSYSKQQYESKFHHYYSTHHTQNRNPNQILNIKNQKQTPKQYFKNYQQYSSSFQPKNIQTSKLISNRSEGSSEQGQYEIENQCLVNISGITDQINVQQPEPKLKVMQEESSYSEEGQKIQDYFIQKVIQLTSRKRQIQPSTSQKPSQLLQDYDKIVFE